MEKMRKLRGRAATVLDQLFHLGGVRVTVRGQGMTLLRRTEFGGFGRPVGGGWMYDAASGIAVDASLWIGAFAVPAGAGRLPALGFGTWGREIALLVELDGESGNGGGLVRMLGAFGGEGMEVGGMVGRGAGAWLDEWEDRDAGWGGGRGGERLAGELAGAEEVDVVVEMEGLLAGCRFRPQLVDRDGSVVKVASRGAKEVLCIDAGAGANRVRREGKRVSVWHRAGGEMPQNSGRAGSLSLAGMLC